METKVAICQAPPVLLDRAASMASALAVLEAAAAQGAGLVMFPEAFLPGYPTWIWRLRPGVDMALGNDIHARLRSNAIDVAAGDLDPLRAAAAKYAVVAVIGMHELDSWFSRTTLFNTVIVIGSDGAILNHHRKLIATNPERMVWGMGDASGLRVVETSCGRIGTLLCWENYMPLARFALYAQGMDILVAPTWDCGDTWLASMRHVAREGGCWVLSSATALQGADVPRSFPGREQLFSDEEWINSGDAIVIRPGGSVAAGPLHREKSILYATIDAEVARAARKSLDPAGHYGRPDLFKLTVDRRRRDPVRFVDSAPGPGGPPAQ
jgi:nitrilase